MRRARSPDVVVGNGWTLVGYQPLTRYRRKGVALSRALADEGINTLAVPSGTLAIYLFLAVLVGIVAAIGPARRAARVDVLRAVVAE